MSNDEKFPCESCKYRLKKPWEVPCNNCYDSNKNIHKNYKSETAQNKAKDDPVSHPNHYQSKSGLEVIDVIKAFTENCTGVEAYYTGNVIKYICRWKKKNGLEDLKKAHQYLDWLIVMEDAKEYARNLANEEKKEPPKNGRYSVNESDCCSGECECKSKNDDCFVPWQIQPTIEKQEAVEIIWDQFCDAFLNALKEVSKEEKEKKDEK